LGFFFGFAVNERDAKQDFGEFASAGTVEAPDSAVQDVAGSSPEAAL
jgi:hypothetical protein